MRTAVRSLFIDSHPSPIHGWIMHAPRASLARACVCVRESICMRPISSEKSHGWSLILSPHSLVLFDKAVPIQISHFDWSHATATLPSDFSILERLIDILRSALFFNKEYFWPDESLKSTDGNNYRSNLKFWRYIICGPVCRTKTWKFSSRNEKKKIIRKNKAMAKEKKAIDNLQEARASIEISRAI